jgi:iron complex outermembrane receptor protein
MKRSAYKFLASACFGISFAPAYAQVAPSTGPASTSLASVSSPSSPAAPSGSANQIQDIVVTAQKRSENLQKVPVSVAAFSGDTLQSRGVKQITELALVTPGLQIGSQNGNVQPFLRGIGNSGAAVGNESSVAVYIDGVYYTALPAGAFATSNVQRVEVLKGPQGTLFGRNASGGVIQLITRDPSHTPTLDASFTYGNYNTYSGNLYASTGLTDTLAVDIAISGQKQVDGYGKNLFTGDRNDYEDYFNVRSKLLFTPTDTTKFTLAIGHSYSLGSIQGGTFPGTTQGTFTAPFEQSPTIGFYDRNDNLDGFTSYKQTDISLKAEQKLPFAQLTSTTAYVHTTSFAQLSANWNPRPEFNVLEPGKINQFTQELQIGSLPGGPLKWVGGLFYYHAIQEYVDSQFRGAALGGGFDQYGKQTADSYAAYGQASYEILPRFTLTGGLRYTMDRTKAEGGTVAPGAPLTPATTLHDHANTNKLTFKAGADYQATDQILLFASFSRGFKSLAYNLLPFSTSHDKPEVLDDYEIGVKSDLFDKRVRINLSAFYYQLQNPQVQLLTTGAVILSNAKSARVKGLDLDISTIVTRGLTFRLSGSYLHSRYKVYGELDAQGNCTIGCAPSNPPAVPPAYGTGPAIPIQAGGNTIPRSPTVSGDVGLDYVTDLGSGKLTVTGDYYYNSGYYFEPDNFLHQPKYGLFSGQIKYAPNDRYYISVWGKNLNNKKYVTYAGAQNGPSGYPFIGGPPRTYGVTAGVKF